MCVCVWGGGVRYQTDLLYLAPKNIKLLTGTCNSQELSSYPELELIFQ